MTHLRKYLLILSILCTANVFSQEVPNGMELFELIKISETYRVLPEMSFDMSFAYADSAQPNNVLEQIAGSYKIKKGKYWAMIDSIEYVQGDNYNLAIYHRDGVISVSDRLEATPILQIPVIDSLFRAANVTGMQVTRLNDSTRSLKINFQPFSNYRAYEIQYDVKTALIRRVDYYMPDIGDANPEGSGVVRISILFSNYSTTSLSEEFFDEGRFVQRQGNKIVPKTDTIEFEDYQMMINGKIVPDIEN